MSREPNQQILISPLFLSGLLLLVLNDFFLKQYFGNFLTGKISDFAGLFIFPLFFVAIFRRYHLPIYIFTAILFVLWKSPFADVPINLWNSLGFIHIGRIIDFSDLSALLILPFSYLYFDNSKNSEVCPSSLRRVGAGIVILASVLAFTATTLVKDRHLSLGGGYFVKESRTEILNSLNHNVHISNVNSQREDQVFNKNKYPNIETDDKTYFVDFGVTDKICDTAIPTFSVVLIEGKGVTELRSPSVAFECKLYETNANQNRLDESYKRQAQEIFIREVMSSLTQSKSN